MGLQEWSPLQKTISFKSFSAFQSSGRLDAEYYLPKYEQIQQKINAYKNGSILVQSMFRNAAIKSADSLCKYIELSDVGTSGEITGAIEGAFSELPSRARQRVQANDVIVSSVEGSLSSCALIPPEYDGALCSTGFHVLKSDVINSETLLLLCKSWPIQLLLKQRCSGTILTAISANAIQQISFPLIEEQIQEQLAEKVQESFALRQESKRLLELAKHAVEVAIEQGEEMALHLLEDEGNA